MHKSPTSPGVGHLRKEFIGHQNGRAWFTHKKAEIWIKKLNFSPGSDPTYVS